MGRRKPGKQRRPRDRRGAAEYPLREPAPPGPIHRDRDRVLDTGRPPVLGERTAAAPRTCRPDLMLHDLPLQAAMAVVYVRCCRGRREEPDFEEFAARHHDGDAEAARSAWDLAWSSGHIEQRGCEACPAGHLCTRT